MTNNTKQSQETFIQWRIAGNPVVSGESVTEAIMTIHPDGRVTTSDRLKPTETAALVLDQIKTMWLKDAQATKIRELQDRIKRMEEAVDAAISFCEFHGPVGATPDTARLIAKNLRKAKEAKP